MCADAPCTVSAASACTAHESPNSIYLSDVCLPVAPTANLLSRPHAVPVASFPCLQLRTRTTRTHGAMHTCTRAMHTCTHAHMHTCTHAPVSQSTHGCSPQSALYFPCTHLVHVLADDEIVPWNPALHMQADKRADAKGVSRGAPCCSTGSSRGAPCCSSGSSRAVGRVPEMSASPTGSSGPVPALAGHGVQVPLLRYWCQPLRT